MVVEQGKSTVESRYGGDRDSNFTRVTYTKFSSVKDTLRLQRIRIKVLTDGGGVRKYKVVVGCGVLHHR